MADKDELDRLWCGQTTGPPRKGEDMLTIAMERVNRFDRKIRARNLRECLVGLVVTAIFAAIAWQSPNALARAGNLLVAVSGLWYGFCIMRYGREAPSPAPDRSVADFQQAMLRKYDYQIRLLKNVKYWYLLPPYVGLLLASAGIVMANIAGRKPAWPQLVAAAVYTAVFGTVWWLNEVYAVGKLRRQRARLLDEMRPPL
ncbi:MAG: hypothetical protein ABSC93_18105 [Bryobacteraceae bacterium]|jgi:hypothetical protein